MSTEIELQPVHESALLRGFSTIYYKENCDWMHTHRWWINAIFWPIVLCGLVANLLLVANAFPLDITEEVIAVGGLTEYIISLGLSVFFDFGLRVVGFGVIVLSFDLLISERENGVVEWMLTKPVTRRSIILAKLAANGKFILLFLIFIPAIITYGMLSIKMDGFFPVVPYLAGVGIMILHSFFYLALAIMLGTLTSSRMVVLGISAVLLLGGSILMGLVDALKYVSPFSLSNLATIVTGNQMISPGLLWPPILSTLAWSVIFVYVALRKFKRLEL